MRTPSEFAVTVVKLDKFGKHPNADTLSIISIDGRPVVFKTDEFPPHSLAVHIPPDSIVDTTREEFSWLAKEAKADGSYRVRFCKIRKVPSYGFFVPAPLGLKAGQNVQELFGVTKYEPPVDERLDGRTGVKMPREGTAPRYGIESIHKYNTVLQPGEHVIATEKIHGMNGRWINQDGELYCGSHNQFKENSVWNKMAEKYNLKQIPEGYAVYGEVYGSGIMDLHYGLTDGEQAVMFFDVYDSNTGEWLNPYQFADFCAFHHLPTVPVVYDGMFSHELMLQLAEGPTLTNGGHTREGLVIKPREERWDVQVGRVFLKLVGQGYLSRKGG